MKKILCSLLVLLVTGPLFAQLRLGLEAGVNVAKLNLKEAHFSGFDPKMSSKVGLRAGVLADIGIGNHLAVQPGLFYNTRGGKQKIDLGLFGSFEEAITVHTVQLMILALYKMQVGPGRVFAGLGPSADFGVKAKSKQKMTDYLGASTDTTTDIEFGSDTTEMKRLDFAANFCAGYEMDMGLFLRIGYYLGLANLINNGAITDDKLRNRAFMITLGYFLGRREN